MKNQRLTQNEVYELREAAKEIHQLVKMEQTSFSFDKGKDEEVKRTIKPWLVWFDVQADKIDEILGE